MDDLQLPLEGLVQPFFAQGCETVFASLCCRKLYVGVQPAQTCRTCKGKPKAVVVKPDAIADAAQQLQSP